MIGARRLSHSISQGDGISILADVVDAASARNAKAHGATGLVVRGGATVGKTDLPVVAYGASVAQAVAAAADAVVICGPAEDEVLLALVGEAEEAGLECVFEVRDEADLERVLEQVDPEIILLHPTAGEAHHPIEHVLELLPDVPAGKLAIAALAAATRAEIEELERAGFDAVLVRGEVEPLVADAPPDV